MRDLSASEQKLAAVMIVELTGAGHTPRQTGYIVEDVILHYRSLRDNRPSLMLRIGRLAKRVLFPIRR